MRFTVSALLQFEAEAANEDELRDAIARSWAECDHFGGVAAVLPFLDCDPSLEIDDLRELEPREDAADTFTEVVL